MVLRFYDLYAFYEYMDIVHVITRNPENGARDCYRESVKSITEKLTTYHHIYMLHPLTNQMVTTPLNLLFRTFNNRR